MSSAQSNTLLVAASWLVGSTIAMGAASLFVLDAQVMEYPPVVTGWSDSSSVQSLNGLNGVNGLNGINGLNGVNGLNGINGLNGVNGLNGINAGDEWGENSWSSAPYNDNPGQDVWRPLDGDAQSALSQESISSSKEWNIPLGVPMDAPLNAPQNAGPDIRAIYPPTWQYPPLVEKVSQGLSSLGVDDGPAVQAPRGAAPEPLPPSHVSPTPSAPAQEPVQSVWTGIVGSVVGFFQRLWSW